MDALIEAEDNSVELVETPCAIVMKTWIIGQRSCDLRHGGACYEIIEDVGHCLYWISGGIELPTFPRCFPGRGGQGMDAAVGY
jgi:hypothetical protein